MSHPITPSLTHGVRTESAGASLIEGVVQHEAHHGCRDVRGCGRCGAGSFTTLATALEKTGLIATLKGTGPFTVFAPTDEAFAKLPAGTLDKLLANPEQLKAILLYHVVSGDVPSSAAAKLTSAKTVNGAEIKIAPMGNTLMINDAHVAKADVKASNGVIHVIDKVILPPAGK